jgi:membrane protein
VHRFCEGEKPSEASGLSHELEIPVRLVRQLLYDLSESGILSEAKKGEDKELAYQPATDVDKITVKFVIDRLERRGTSSIPVLQSAEMNKLSDCLRQFDATLEKSPANILLKNL